MRRWLLRAFARSCRGRCTTLQAGGLLNAFGNGIVLPFTFIYLHNVRGIGLGTAGLVLGTNAAVSLVAGPIAGDRLSTGSEAAARSPRRARFPRGRLRRLRIDPRTMAGVCRARS